MQFRLHYRGPLHANADGRRKHAIRMALHPQLATLWGSEPLSSFRNYYWTMPGGGQQASRVRGAFRFIPLVTERAIASLQIPWLRPGLLGSLVSKSGDIDDRLKTLFDALRVTADPPKDDEPGDKEKTVYCLLDDDVLITEVEVITDRLLEPAGETDVEMIIAVAARSAEAGLPQAAKYTRFMS